MSRYKGARLSDNEQVMTQVWHGLVDTLRLLPSIPTKVADERAAPTAAERENIGDALDKVALLISMRKGESGSGDYPGTAITTSSTNANANGNAASTGNTVSSGYKRDGDAPITASGPKSSALPTFSISTPSTSGGTPLTPSTSLPFNPSLVPLHGGGGGNKRKRPLSISSSPAPNGPNTSNSTGHHDPVPASGQGSGSRAATPSAREANNRSRKEQYSDQLPLRSGRPIAFRVPPAKVKGEDISGLEDGWILATVKKCLNGDKTKYDVADADDVNLSWSTTLKSIIPLPDENSPTHLSSHPVNLEDFPAGSVVLALYPDTTSFYRATVVSAPIPGTGMGGAPRPGARAEPGALKGMYRLSFVDDGDEIREVEARMVVMHP